MGLPFRSGHYLALRHFPASSIGPGFTAVWHRDPHRRWTFHADAPAEVSCARYFGATSAGGAERVPIDVTWTGPRSLRVRVPDVLAWQVHLAATAATRLLSSASWLLPDPRWDSDRVLGAMGRVAGLLLRAGRVRLATLGADRAAALKADMLAAARSFDTSEDGDTLVLRMDYLEAVIHKPAA
jgi:hypothetical protein